MHSRQAKYGISPAVAPASPCSPRTWQPGEGDGHAASLSVPQRHDRSPATARVPSGCEGRRDASLTRRCPNQASASPGISAFDRPQPMTSRGLRGRNGYYRCGFRIASCRARGKRLHETRGAPGCRPGGLPWRGRPESPPLADGSADGSAQQATATRAMPATTARSGSLPPHPDCAVVVIAAICSYDKWPMPVRCPSDGLAIYMRGRLLVRHGLSMPFFCRAT